MNYEDIFNKNTLNIFTDASISKIGNETVGCSGCIATTTDNYGKSIIVDEFYFINRDTTNNDSELKAIHAGIYKAIQYRNNYKQINLFSDSLVSVKGLKEWIFNWINNMKLGVLYGSSGEVKNQELIKSIISDIITSQLQIKIYHQKGHIKINDYDDLLKAQRIFLRENNITAPLELIKDLCYYNDIVDNTSRQRLLIYVSDKTQSLQLQKNPISHLIDTTRIRNEYRILVK